MCAADLNGCLVITIWVNARRTQGDGDKVIIFVYDAQGENLIGIRSIRVQDIVSEAH